MRVLSLFALIGALATATATAAAEPAEPARFDPVAFFSGHTEGLGEMKIILHRTATTQVHGHGSVDREGTLILDQRVERPGKPDRNREWRIRRVAPGRYTGSLTDAVGPITGEAIGNRFHITYRMKDHLSADQWLTLAADDRSARNVMHIRKRGIPVARLVETIRRTGR